MREIFINEPELPEPVAVLFRFFDTTKYTKGDELGDEHGRMITATTAKARSVDKAAVPGGARKG